MSGRARSSEAIRSSWPRKTTLRYPPIFFGATLPVSRKRCISLITVLSATSKRAATPRHDSPFSTARTSRVRNSNGSATIHAGLQTSDQLESEFAALGNPLSIPTRRKPL
jgi:hypothetical protein